MSLQIRYPLSSNADGSNLGLYQSSHLISISEIFGYSGNITSKISNGLALNFDLYAQNVVVDTQGFLNNNTKTFSISFWVKLPKENTTPREYEQDTDYMTLFCDRTTVGNGLSIFYSPSNLGFRFDTGSGPNNQAWFKYANINYIPTDWTHYCFTYNGTKKMAYINGVEWTQVKQANTLITLPPINDNWSAGLSAMGESFSFGASYEHTNFSQLFTNSGNEALGDYILNHSSNPIWQNSYMNDFRIYDHCLSPREIKLLAQGLVAHYKLDGNEIENPNLLNNSNGAGITQSGYQEYIFDSNTNGFGRFLNSGEKCTLTICFTPAAHFSRFRPHLDKGSNPLTEDIYPNGTGQQIITVTSLNNWSYKDGAPDTSNGKGNLRLYIRNTNEVYDNSAATVHWVKLQLGDHPEAKTWTPSISENPNQYLLEDDCSGHGNHGTCSAPFGLTSDAPRYKNCKNFENNKYINCGRGAMITDALTVSWWGKMNDWSLYSSTPMRALSCTEGGGWNFEPNSGKMCFAMGTGSTSNSYKNAVGTTTFDSMADNSWHMFTGTYDGFATRIYVDGELEATNTAYSSKTPIFYNASNSIFIGAEAGGSATSPSTERFNGKISDVRIYATALSAAAVKELYQSSISFLDNGTLQCSEIVESPTNLKYNQNGITQAELISEVGYTNKMKIKTLPDGSAWARIYWLNVAENPTSKDSYFKNTEDVAYCTSNNRFSLMQYVDKFKKQEIYIKNLMPTDTSSNYAGDATSTVTYENRSFKVVGNNSGECYLWTAKDNIPYIAGHKYYAAVEIYQENINGSTDFYFGAREPNCYSGKKVIAKKTWTKVSGILKQTNWQSGNVRIRLDYNFGTSSEPMWFRNMTLVDLTTSFGEGKEPTIEWCDANIQAGFMVSAINVDSDRPLYEFMLTYPSAYTQLEYIQSDGRQIIKTGIKTQNILGGTRGHKWNFDIEFNANSTRQLMGYGPSAQQYWGLQTDNRYSIQISDTRIGYGGKRDSIIHQHAGDATTSVTPSYLEVNGERLSLTNTSLTLDTEYTLFGLDMNGAGSYDYLCHAKLYHCQCQNSFFNEEYDFIPVRRNSDGAIGLLDILHDTFYSSATETGFIPGPEVKESILYNRWEQYGSPNLAYNDIDYYFYSHSAFKTYKGPITKSQSSNNSIYSINRSGNWWAPIGQLTSFSSGGVTGIPAADGKTHQETELWVRIDNLPKLTKLSMLDDAIQAYQIYEL